MTNVIFGGSSGIGQRVLNKFAKTEDQVINVDIKESDVKGVIEVVGDLNEDRFIERVVNKLREVNSIKSIVWSIRYRNQGAINDPIEITKECMELEIYSFMKIIAGLDDIIRERGCSVVVISSIASKLISSQEIYYNIVKSAQESMTRHYAVKYGSHSMARFNSICPGVVKMAERANKSEQEKRLRKSLELSSIPRNEAVTAEEIADLIYFLASKSSASINGETIVCDGGESILDQYYVASRMAASR